MSSPSSGAASPAIPPPAPGLLYRVDTTRLTGMDPKPQRPAVVLALPAVGLTTVRLLMRTTQTHVRGIAHAANPALGLTKDGVFAFTYLRSIELRDFSNPRFVAYLGQLDSATWTQIEQWWERA